MQTIQTVHYQYTNLITNRWGHNIYTWLKTVVDTCLHTAIAALLSSWWWNEHICGGGVERKVLWVVLWTGYCAIWVTLTYLLIITISRPICLPHHSSPSPCPGDLKTFLLARRQLVGQTSKEAEDVSAENLTRMALDIAYGLQYLRDLHYIHRSVQQYLIAGVIRMSDTQSREPGFKSSCCCFEAWAVFVHSTLP